MKTKVEKVGKRAAYKYHFVPSGEQLLRIVTTWNIKQQDFYQ